MQDNNQREYNFVIVNEMDRPCVDHVAQVMPDGGTCRYLHPRLRYWAGLSTEHATNIKDFGFDFEIDEKRGTVTFFRVAPSKATYKQSGQTRGWQDSDEDFTLHLWCHERKEKNNA